MNNGTNSKKHNRKSYALLKRIDIAEEALANDVISVSIKYNTKPQTIRKWINMLDTLKEKRKSDQENINAYAKQYYANMSNEKKKKRNAYKADKHKRFYTKHFFKNIIKLLSRNLRKRGIEHKVNVNIHELWSIAKKQKLICPLSGIRLTRENISIDHILPLSKGGKTDATNLQFVEKHVNIMKNNKTASELVEYCKKIYFHSSPLSY